MLVASRQVLFMMVYFIKISVSPSTEGTLPKELQIFGILEPGSMPVCFCVGEKLCHNTELELQDGHKCRLCKQVTHVFCATFDDAFPLHDNLVCYKCKPRPPSPKKAPVPPPPPPPPKGRKKKNAPTNDDSDFFASHSNTPSDDDDEYVFLATILG